MEGFTPVFKKCESIFTETDIITFRESPTFAFAFQNQPVDQAALSILYGISKELYVQYMKVNKCAAGYTDAVAYSPLDMLDTRHMMMSAIIFSHCKCFDHIVEIGGGYGNWLRLNKDVVEFKMWTIIDMPFMLKLQRWYLQHEEMDMARVDFVSAYDYDGWAAEHDSFDLVIGAHSLSEMSMQDFNLYFGRVLKKTRYLFYAAHTSNCGADMLAVKLRLLDVHFDTIAEYKSEGGNVRNILYERKQTK